MQTIVDNQVHDLNGIIEVLAKQFKLSDIDRVEVLPSGKQRTFDNRVGWARTYLKKAGLLETPGVGKVKITPKGIELLKKNPTRIDRKFLMQFPTFVEFQKVQKRETDTNVIEVTEQTPTELLEVSYRNLRAALAEEILDRIKNCSPRFFENLVLDLLVEMGYGGSRRDAERVGRSGDGGIDGTINEDKLGLDVVYVQAKRWDKGTVGRKEIQAFVGSLEPKKARKGVFITTSQFTEDARDYVKGTEKRIVLIDGEELAQLMIDYNIGVAPVANYDVKKVDADYFSET
jgi:restriction system protein